MILDLLQTANIQALSGRIPEAINTCEEALRLAPAYVPALNLLAYLFAVTGNTERAISLFEDVLRLQPDHKEAANNLAAMLAQLQRNSEAIEVLKQLIVNDPEHKAALENLEALAQRTGREEEIMNFLILILNKHHCASIIMSMGRISLKRKRWTIAQLYFLRASQAKPGDADILCLQAQLYKEIGALSDAEFYARKALVHQPNHPIAQELLRNLQPSTRIVSAFVDTSTPLPPLDFESDLPSMAELLSYDDLETRNSFAIQVASQINARFPFLNPVEQIRKVGYAQLKPLLARQQIRELVDFLKTEPVYDGHVYSFSDRTPRPLTDDYRLPFASYRLEQTLRAPHLFEATLNPYLLQLVSEYLGCTPTIYSVQAWWSLPSEHPVESQQYHRDYDDFRFLVLFIYLTDVDEHHGPHCYLRGSHVGQGNGEDIIIGPAGTTILEDTYGFHKGQTPTGGRRLLAWVRYGLGKNHHAGPNRLEPTSRAVVGDRITFDNETKYITRLLFND